MAVSLQYGGGQGLLLFFFLPIVGNRFGLRGKNELGCVLRPLLDGFGVRILGCKGGEHLIGELRVCACALSLAIWA